MLLAINAVMLTFKVNDFVLYVLLEGEIMLIEEAKGKSSSDPPTDPANSGTKNAKTRIVTSRIAFSN